MYKVRDRNNTEFKEPLDCRIEFKVTSKEKMQVEAVAKENFINGSELMRNLIRTYISEYAMSPNLRKTLKITNMFDTLLMEKRIISSRNDSNLSKAREILIDFEAFLDQKLSNIDESELTVRRDELLYILKETSINDEFLYNKIKGQASRILKNKRLKVLEC